MIIVNDNKFETTEAAIQSIKDYFDRTITEIIFGFPEENERKTVVMDNLVIFNVKDEKKEVVKNKNTKETVLLAEALHLVFLYSSSLNSESTLKYAEEFFKIQEQIKELL
jgi:hypothetical protein